MFGIITYISPKCMVNVSRYSSPMEHVGMHSIQFQAAYFKQMFLRRPIQPAKLVYFKMSFGHLSNEKNTGWLLYI